MNSFRTDNDVNSELKRTLKGNFLENNERFKTMTLNERPYYTNTTKKPSENEIRNIDNISNEYTTNLKSVEAMFYYYDINLMHRTTAMT